MILDELTHAGLYHGIGPGFAQALEYLAETDLASMAPERYDASAPPTRASVTDPDGNPTVGSNKFQFMIFLDVAEQHIKTTNKEFWELATTGYVTTHKYTVVYSTEQAVALSTTPDRTLYTFANPAPTPARSATPLPDDLKSQFSVQPDLLVKYDRSGFDTFDKWFTNKAMRNAFHKATGGLGKRLLTSLQEKKIEYNSDPEVNGILVKYVQWFFTKGIPAGSTLWA